MAATKISVVYSVTQNVVRTIISNPVDDSHIDLHKQNLQPNEAWLDIPLEASRNFKSVNDVQSYVAGIIGPPSSDRCLVVAGDDTVLAIIKADPIIDDHPAGVLIQDESADVGIKYDFTGGQP